MSHAAFGNDELAKRPSVRCGDRIHCSACGGVHEAQAATDSSTGQPSDVILFVCCGTHHYMVGLAGRLINMELVR